MVFGPPLISILYTREYYLIRMGGFGLLCVGVVLVLVSIFSLFTLFFTEEGESYSASVLPLTGTLVAFGFLFVWIFSGKKVDKSKNTQPLVDKKGEESEKVE